jgi:hypothetical protein
MLRSSYGDHRQKQGLLVSGGGAWPDGGFCPRHPRHLVPVEAMRRTATGSTRGHYFLRPAMTVVPATEVRPQIFVVLGGLAVLHGLTSCRPPHTESNPILFIV